MADLFGSAQRVKRVPLSAGDYRDSAETLLGKLELHLKVRHGRGLCYLTVLL
ncbi:MAG: hypothetical protein RSE46_13650 [Janthinobacterium sp.]